LRTVPSERCRRRAISDTGEPSAPASSTSRSRGERALAVLQGGSGELGVDDAFPGRRAPDGVGEPLGGRVLDEEAGRPSLHSRESCSPDDEARGLRPAADSARTPVVADGQRTNERLGDGHL
jgi:hypothetical protein